MKFPSMPQKGNPVQGTIREIIEYLRATRITSVNGGSIRETPNGTSLQFKPGKSGKTSSAAGICFFGEIIDIDDTSEYTKGIRGGIIHCGDQNWNMDYQGLNLATDGAWLVSIEVALEVNRDDDGEILMPGIKTGTQPTGAWTKTVWTEGTAYPANTTPVASTGLGTIILPIGKLTITEPPEGSPPETPNTARLEATGCGHFVITHCAGTLGYTRA